MQRIDERGAVLPLLALTLAGLVVGVLLLGGLSARVHDRARAQAAADAAALAGAAAGQAAAADLATANGAALTRFEADGDAVLVEVRTYEGATARARAERRLTFVSGG